jgi:hypothetical protein
MWPISGKKMTYETLHLISDWEELSDPREKLYVHFDSKGRCTGFAGANSKESPAEGTAIHVVKIEPGSWIHALTLVIGVLERKSESEKIEGTVGDPSLPSRCVVGVGVWTTNNNMPTWIGSQDGAHTLMHVGYGTILIGLKFSRMENLVCTLSLLQAEPPERKTSVNGVLLGPILNALYRSWPDSTQIWADSLPPSGVRATKSISGHLSADGDRHHVKQWLDLGDDDAKRSRICAIGADVTMSALVVRFSDGSRKSIGAQAEALDWLIIDGSGGERIDRVFAFGDALACALFVGTNRGRQKTWGTIRNTRRDGANNFRDGIAQPVSGVFANWDYGVTCTYDRPEGQLRAMGVLVGPEVCSPDSNRYSDLFFGGPSIPGADLDIEHNLWQNCTPPAHFIEMPETRVYGRPRAEEFPRGLRGNENFQHSIYASWLDFTKAIRSITITTIHPKTRQYRKNLEEYLRTQFVGLQVFYADGTESSVGPTEFPNVDVVARRKEVLAKRKTDFQYLRLQGGRAEDADEAKKPLYCFCGYNLTSDRAKWPCASHYYRQSWEVDREGGETLQTLRIYQHDALMGMQFVTTTGLASPVFGTDEGGVMFELQLSEKTVLFEESGYDESEEDNGHESEEDSGHEREQEIEAVSTNHVPISWSSPY